MRDEGFPFLRSDLYCENIFARGFDLSDRDPDFQDSFVLLTAFELFEHFEHPKCQIEKMFGLSDTILFSTELQPDRELTSADDWWYFVPETGQHIAFYNLRLAGISGRPFWRQVVLEWRFPTHDDAQCVARGSVHLAGSKQDVARQSAATLDFGLSKDFLIAAAKRRGSLTWPDFELVRSRLSGRPKGK